ncbi:hypothetical protein DY000_02047820 [Brassica cretica]|uniref:Uncharacterized protein n=1 Tax=Brassica cretica TaxID=69181 RepID=A0ABQ7EP89_BRACR|nr:hypothetical protein DY000_02047820 [Brassica cretica]
MSSSVSLVSLKNIHNLNPINFHRIRSSIGTAPSSEGVLTCNIYLWHLHSIHNRCSSIDRRLRLSIDDGLLLSIDGGAFSSDVQEMTYVMSPILDRIVQTDCGARRCTDQLTGSDVLAHSAGDSWWSAHLSLAECSGPDQCGRVRAVTEPFRRTVWDDGSMSNPDRTKQ